MFKKFFIFSLLISALFVGCAQEEGERCEQDDDCDTGLKCCKPLSATEGTCTLDDEESCTYK